MKKYRITVICPKLTGPTTAENSDDTFRCPICSKELKFSPVTKTLTVAEGHSLRQIVELKT